MDADKVAAKIDGYLAELKELKGLSYKDGRERYYTLRKKVDGFLTATFADADKKIRDLNSFFAVIGGNISPEEDRRRKEEDYQDDLKKLERHLVGYKEEIMSAEEFGTMRPDQEQPRQRREFPTVHIENFQGNLAVGGDAYSVQVFNQTIEKIEKSNAKPEEKSSAKKLLQFVNDNVPQWWPVIAPAVMKVLGVS